MPWVVERNSSGWRARSSSGACRWGREVGVRRPPPLGPWQLGCDEQQRLARRQFAGRSAVGDELVKASVTDHAAGGEDPSGAVEKNRAAVGS